MKSDFFTESTEEARRGTEGGRVFGDRTCKMTATKLNRRVGKDGKKGRGDDLN